MLPLHTTFTRFAAAACVLTLATGLAFSRPPEDAPSPRWLAGHWVGEGFGGTVEEWWSPERNGEMMGAFRLIIGDETKILELVTLEHRGDLWSMRLRHFDPDLSSWEKDNKSLHWDETVLDADRAGFGPVLYERVGHDKLSITVEVSQGGETHKEVLTLRRADSR